MEWEVTEVTKTMSKVIWTIYKRKSNWRVPNKRNKKKKHDANDVYLAIYPYIRIRKIIIFGFLISPSSYLLDIYLSVSSVSKLFSSF